MRANPLVCVETDEVTAYDEWKSVIVNGRYEELRPAPDSDGALGRAPERSGVPVEVLHRSSVDDRHKNLEMGEDDVMGNEHRRVAFEVLGSLPE